ncbi:MAG: hypothetical protein QM749_20225 [Aquabacterium sp.]
MFNPARLKVKMMAREMPRRYWPQPARSHLDRTARGCGTRAQRADDSARPARHGQAPAPRLALEGEHSAHGTWRACGHRGPGLEPTARSL